MYNFHEEVEQSQCVKLGSQIDWKIFFHLSPKIQFQMVESEKRE